MDNHVKKNQFLLLLFFIISLLSCQNKTKPQLEANAIVLRSYCTEIGRFDLIFYDDEVSGAYALLPKKSLGAIWGNLKERQVVGRWIDEDGQGDILIEFNEDLSWFTTSYRNDKFPEKWYKDQWHGHIRPNSKTNFDINDKDYKCE